MAKAEKKSIILEDEQLIVAGIITEMSKRRKNKRDLDRVLLKFHNEKIRRFKSIKVTPSTLLHTVITEDIRKVLIEHSDTLEANGIKKRMESLTIKDLAKFPRHKLTKEILGGLSQWHVVYLRQIIQKAGL